MIGEATSLEQMLARLKLTAIRDQLAAVGVRGPHSPAWDPQVIIALAVTRDGMPVRSWVLPGDTADVTTVERIKEDLCQMRLGRALFVGDAGLYARANLVELSRGAGRYILATPIGRVKEIKDEVLSRPGRYAEITANLRAKEVIVGQGERRRRYILCLNAEEAAREKRHRDEILDLAHLLVASEERTRHAVRAGGTFGASGGGRRAVVAHQGAQIHARSVSLDADCMQQFTGCC